MAHLRKRKPLYFFYNTVALDRMRICTSPNISDPLGVIENTCIVQKNPQTAVRRTEDIWRTPNNMF